MYKAADQMKKRVVEEAEAAQEEEMEGQADSITEVVQGVATKVETSDVAVETGMETTMVAACTIGGQTTETTAMTGEALVGAQMVAVQETLLLDP